jgi:hypothetical protein
MLLSEEILLNFLTNMIVHTQQAMIPLQYDQFIFQMQMKKHLDIKHAPPPLICTINVQYVTTVPRNYIFAPTF